MVIPNVKGNRKRRSMTDAERIEELHKKMGVLKQKRERRIEGILGSMSFVLVSCLIGLMIRAQRLGAVVTAEVTDASYAGSSMLFTNAGGYVLFAVIAFAAGVAVTLLCIRMRGHDTDSTDET